jgi:hypothetical protein
LREKHRPKVSENWVLKKMFRPNREEVTGKWRRLHKEKLRKQHLSRNIIRVIKLKRIRWAGLAARVG